MTYNLTVEEDVLLGDEKYDSDRVGDLISRIVLAADTLEREFLPGKDEPMDMFREGLKGEVVDEI